MYSFELFKVLKIEVTQKESELFPALSLAFTVPLEYL